MDEVLVDALAIEFSRLAWLGKGKGTLGSRLFGRRGAISCVKDCTEGPGLPALNVVFKSGATILVCKK